MVNKCPAGWHIYNLEDAMSAIIDYRGKTPKKTPFGIPLITAKIVKNGTIETPNEFIDPSDYDKWMRRGIPEVGDVLITTEAPLGEVAQLRNNNVALAQRLITLRGKKELLDNTYLKYLMQSHLVQHQLVSRSSGTTVTGIKQSELRQVKLPIASLPEQRQIASILGTLDDKIELNRRMNETLEEMARALFKSWFVAFDPVLDRALAAGNPIPPKLQEKAERRAAFRKEHPELAESKQLPPEIFNLFPDSFVDSPLGVIPKGWSTTFLKNIIHVKHGYAFKGDFFSEKPTDNILLTPGNFRIGGGFKSSKFKYYDGPIDDDYILKPNDLILTMTDLSKSADTLGYPALVPESDSIQYLHNQRLGKVEFITNPVGRNFLYQHFCSKEYRDEILASASGTTVKHTSPKKILSHAIALSDNNIEQNYESVCVDYFAQINLNNANIEILRQLRDTLRPKLLSGELQVNEAEKVAEAVV
ncbi:restriction endonuclease subunit S [Planctomycetota bacterium]|nr:restriction endonuclease subunit S [Planctomycetota bacterium]